jgi:hypothetical protein
MNRRSRSWNLQQTDQAGLENVGGTVGTLHDDDADGDASHTHSIPDGGLDGMEH